ncbi:MAG: endonuclease/exonuclease/phosphatase family protein [Crocinitomicaceae bacterium]|jgi:endonuclease/exonuclease/phosphatase family metal-dependent hydrolase|nr:endonuclease/exonuclease/phosphatase family protein [Crocinitomicaceae bacterium]
MRTFILFSVALSFSISSWSQTSLMSFNLRYNNPNDGENAWENRKAEVVDLIEKYAPEIMGIQEGLYDQMQYLDSNLRQYSYLGVGRDDGKTKGEYAGIFYRHDLWTLNRSYTFWLSETPLKPSVGWDASMERIVTYAWFIHNQTGETLHVFNAHFDHIGEKAQYESADLITNLIYKFNLTEEKVVVMGDFNSLPDSEPIQLFSSYLEDSRNVENHFGPDGTFNNFNTQEEITKRIDYIFTMNLSVQSQLHINDRRKNGLCISDHLPVYVECQ